MATKKVSDNAAGKRTSRAKKSDAVEPEIVAKPARTRKTTAKAEAAEPKATKVRKPRVKKVAAPEAIVEPVEAQPALDLSTQSLFIGDAPQNDVLPEVELMTDPAPAAPEALIVETGFGAVGFFIPPGMGDFVLLGPVPNDGSPAEPEPAKKNSKDGNGRTKKPAISRPYAGIRLKPGMTEMPKPGDAWIPCDDTSAVALKYLAVAPLALVADAEMLELQISVMATERQINQVKFVDFCNWDPRLIEIRDGGVETEHQIVNRMLAAVGERTDVDGVFLIWHNGTPLSASPTPAKIGKEDPTPLNITYARLLELSASALRRRFGVQVDVQVLKMTHLGDTVEFLPACVA